MEASGDSGPVVIGEGGSACPADAIYGSIELTGDTGGLLVEENVIYSSRLQVERLR